MRHIALYINLLFATIGFTQKQNNVWVLNNGGMLDFNFYPPKFTRVLQENTNVTSTSSVSDSFGNLILSTNGLEVWNKDFELIEGNPVYSLGGNTPALYSIIVPVPLQRNNFYVFTIGFRGGNGIYYAKIDMNANNGKGKVVFKDRPIEENQEQVTLSIALGASECRGVFLLTYENFTNIFIAYRISSDGIEKIETRMLHNPLDNLNSGYSFISNSTGNLIACGAFTPHIYQFDTKTGLFNPRGVKLNNLKAGMDIGTFSADGKRFYTNKDFDSTILTPSGPFIYSKRTTYQYDVSIFDSSTINSKPQIVEVIFKPEINPGNFVLAPNKKVYRIESISLPIDPIVRKWYAKEIVNPNAGDPPTYIKDSALMYNYGKWNGFKFNYLQNYYEHLPKLVLPNSFCVGDSLQLKADTAYASTRYKWFVNDSLISTEAQPKIKLGKAGKQNITLHINECLVEQDIEVSPSLVPILKDTSLCEAQPIRLTAPSNGSKYLWNTQDTTQSISITTGGKYQVKVSNTCKQILDSANVKLYPKLYDFLNPSTEVCEQDQINLTAPKGATQYIWSTGDTTASISIAQAGKYKVEISNRCYALSDSTEVIFFNEIYKTTAQNLVTANGDGANEDLVLFSDDLKDYTLSIYNRWGARVFVSHNSKEAWKPSEVEAGVYYYSVSAAYCNGKTYEQKGWVQVMK